MYFKRISDLQPITEYNLDSLWVETSQSYDGNWDVVNSAPTDNGLEGEARQLQSFENLSQVSAFVSKRTSLAEIFQNITNLTAKNVKITNLTAEYADLSFITSYYIEGKQNNKTLIFNMPSDSKISSTEQISSVLNENTQWPSDVTELSVYPAMVVNETGVTAKHLHVPGEAILTAAAAYWADLAELYKSDKNYSVGTLVKFGGKEEITIADDEVNAVITEKPAYLMNLAIKNDEKALGIVLTGRSKIRVVGEIEKFDRLVLSGRKGVARKKFIDNEKIIGIALESNYNPDEKLIEAVLKLSF